MHKRMMSMALGGAVVLFAFGACASVPPEAAGDGVWNVMDFGADPSGETDNSEAFQEALDAAREAGGGVVWAPTGEYVFTEPITVPQEVILRGVYHYAPAHAGIRDNTDELPEFGTTFLVRAGAGEDEDGTPFISLNNNSTLQGVSIYYPDQDPASAPPTPYPYAVRMRGNNPAIIDVQMLNPYNAIDASQNQRALIRNVHGQPLHIGVYVDAIYDIGRIENVHWNPWWSMEPDLYKWQEENGTAFIFGRSDWHYVHNTFAFGYNIGYHFIATDAGATNANLLGIGADRCHTGIKVEQTQPYGLLITNGKFVSFEGEEPTMVRVTDTHEGTVSFVNCSFWGPAHRIGVLEGQGTTRLTDSTFHDWGRHDTVTEAFRVRSGSVMFRGNEFHQDKPQIVLEEPVTRAIISENFIHGEQRIDNRAAGNVVISNNVSDIMETEDED